jgi:hypothetical protein
MMKTKLGRSAAGAKELNHDDTTSTTIRLGGAAAAQATAGDRALRAWKQAQEVIGTALLPVVDAFSNVVADKAVPAAEDLGKWLTSTGIPKTKEFGGALKPIAEDVLPLLGDAANVTLDVLKALEPIVGGVTAAFGKLPDAGQKALLLGTAVGVLGRRSRVAGDDVGFLAGNFDKARVKSLAMRGGLLAGGTALASLSGSARKADEGLGILVETAGAAAIGFAVAGPVGAAIGGGTTALFNYKQAIDAASTSQSDFKSSADVVASSLDQVTGAATKATRAVTAKELADNGALAAAKRIGVSYRDVLDAALGNEAAYKRVKAATDAWATSLIKSGDYTEHEEKALRTLLGAINATSDGLDKQRKKIVAATAALTGVPEKVITEFSTPGAPGAIRDAVSVAHAYKLSPKEVRTILKALDYSTPQIKRILRELAKLKDKNIKITTTYVTRRRFESKHAGRSVRSFQADGGVLDFYGDGGMRERHVAQIAPAGAMRVWAEPETGGEAYIPLSPSKRPRSRKILAETASRIGMTAYDNGGINAGGVSRQKLDLTDATVRALSEALAAAIVRRSRGSGDLASMVGRGK